MYLFEMCLINEAWKNKAKQFLPKLNLTKCNLLFFMKNTWINNFVQTFDRHSLIDSKARANHIVFKAALGTINTKMLPHTIVQFYFSGTEYNTIVQ